MLKNRANGTNGSGGDNGNNVIFRKKKKCKKKNKKIKVCDIQCKSRSNINQTPFSLITAGYNNTIASDSPYSMIGAGTSNYISNESSFIGAGCKNAICVPKSGILSGKGNTVNGKYGSIVGGINNTAGGKFSFIGNGYGNYAGGDYSWIISGRSNTVYGEGSSILNGEGNMASGEGAIVVGGCNNEASGYKSVVVNGLNNTASGDYSGILSGCDNLAAGTKSVVVGGGGNLVCDNYSGILAGQNNTINVPSQNTNNVIGGGNSNQIVSSLTGTYESNFIGSGNNNIISFDSTALVGTTGSNFIGSGENNSVRDSVDSGVLSGKINDINLSKNCCILGGNNSKIDLSEDSLVHGELNSVLNSKAGTILGGQNNTVANSINSTILNGKNNIINAPFIENCVVGGSQAVCNHSNCFVWNSTTGTTATTTNDNQVFIRADGDVRFESFTRMDFNGNITWSGFSALGQMIYAGSGGEFQPLPFPTDTISRNLTYFPKLGLDRPVYIPIVQQFLEMDYVFNPSYSGDGGSRGKEIAFGSFNRIDSIATLGPLLLGAFNVNNTGSNTGAPEDESLVPINDTDFNSRKNCVFQNYDVYDPNTPVFAVFATGPTGGDREIRLFDSSVEEVGLLVEGIVNVVTETKAFFEVDATMQIETRNYTQTQQDFLDIYEITTVAFDSLVSALNFLSSIPILGSFFSFLSTSISTVNETFQVFLSEFEPNVQFITWLEHRVETLAGAVLSSQILDVQSYTDPNIGGDRFYIPINLSYKGTIEDFNRVANTTKDVFEVKIKSGFCNNGMSRFFRQIQTSNVNVGAIVELIDNLTNGDVEGFEELIIVSTQLFTGIPILLYNDANTGTNNPYTRLTARITGV